METNNAGDTPLHKVFRGYYEYIKSDRVMDSIKYGGRDGFIGGSNINNSFSSSFKRALLTGGAKWDTKNSKGETPLSLAEAIPKLATEIKVSIAMFITLIFTMMLTKLRSNMFFVGIHF